MRTGRPTVMTEAVVKKLEEAFAFGATDEEACFYGGITKQTLYNYQKSNPEFIDRKEALKQRPILLARQKVVAEITEDVKNAQWYLERKAKDFKQKVEMEGGDSPIRVLLQAYGIDPIALKEGDSNARKDDGAISEAPQDQA